MSVNIKFRNFFDFDNRQCSKWSVRRWQTVTRKTHQPDGRKRSSTKWTRTTTAYWQRKNLSRAVLPTSFSTRCWRLTPVDLKCRLDCFTELAYNILPTHVWTSGNICFFSQLISTVSCIDLHINGKPLFYIRGLLINFELYTCPKWISVHDLTCCILP